MYPQDRPTQQLDLDLGNFKARSRLKALCHVPQAVPGQLLWVGSPHCSPEVSSSGCAGAASVCTADGLREVA